MEKSNDKKFNNIIYYNENVMNLASINEESDYFERETPGAFILCTDMDSFKLIRKEILMNEKNKKLSFNLITTGEQCDKVMKFLDEDAKFKNFIKNVCVYCPDIEKWSQIKSKYDLVDSVVNSQKDVIDFIKNCSSEEIEPYPLIKLITLNDYLEKYKDRHKKISQFYGDLTPQTYKDNLEKMKSLIDQEVNEQKLNDKDKNKLFQSFSVFDLEKNLELSDKLIIREYDKNTFYSDLNKWLTNINSNSNSFEVAAYFAARLMYSLNNYAKQEGKYYESDQTNLYRGIKLPYSKVLLYERAKGKKIVYSTFTSVSESANIADNFSGRKNTQSSYENTNKFSVIVIISNNYKKEWISNGIKIEDISQYKNEKEVIFQPYSFYYVKDVQIDHKNYKADIYLETIGKKEILEEQIKIGKEIKYNDNEKIMEAK